MQGDVGICTSEENIDVIYGMLNLREERGEARISLKYLLSDVNNLKRYYFSLGFHLREFREFKYYEDFGYDNIYDFCDSNLGMCKTAVSNCINVYERFCDFENGVYKTTIQDKYKDYSYSQLCEMLPLTDAQLICFTPDVSVSRMREMKKNMKDSANDFDRIYKRMRGLLGAVSADAIQTSEQHNATEQMQDDNCKHVVSIDSFGSQEFISQLFFYIKDFISEISSVHNLKVDDIEVSGKQLIFNSHDGKYKIMMAVYKK